MHFSGLDECAAMVRRYSGWTVWARCKTSGIRFPVMKRAEKIRLQLGAPPARWLQRKRKTALPGRRRAFAVLLVQIAMAVIRARELSLDEKIAKDRKSTRLNSSH